MTDYYSITKEELNQITRNCFHPDQENCDGCEYESIRGIRCTHEVWKLADEVLARPDPLALLEAWTQYEFRKICRCDGYEETIDFLKNLVYYQQEIINNIRTNPDAVRETGIAKGWWK